MSDELITIEKRDFDPFRVMDALDDDLILQELEGRIVDTWAYHFQQEGKDVWGLSKVGVDMAGREMAKNGEAIREEDISYTPDPTDPNYMLFKACASRVVLGKEGQEVYLEKTFGTKRQAICYFKDGQATKPNPFWYEQGAMKALRNAKARLISDDVRSKIMAMAKEKGKTKGIVDKPPIAAPQAKQPEAKATATEQSNNSPEIIVYATIEKVSSKEGKKGTKAWTLYGVLADGIWYNTFDSNIAEAAKAMVNEKVGLSYIATEKGNNLTGISELKDAA